MKLCQELGSEKLVDIAEPFNVGHCSTVSQTIGRLNRLLLEDKAIRQVYNILSQDLNIPLIFSSVNLIILSLFVCFSIS